MSAFAKRRRGSLRSPLGSAKTGGKGIRTPDLLIANETLYQLSYTPKEEQQLSWRNDFSASDSENSEQPDLLLSLSRRKTSREIRRLRILQARAVIECVLFGRVAGAARSDNRDASEHCQRAIQGRIKLAVYVVLYSGVLDLVTSGTSMPTMIEKRNLIHSQFIWEIVADKLSAAGCTWGYCSRDTAWQQCLCQSRIARWRSMINSPVSNTQCSDEIAYSAGYARTVASRQAELLMGFSLASA